MIKSIWVVAAICFGPILTPVTQAEQLVPRSPTMKPPQSTIAGFHRRDAISVKFRDDLTIRSVAGALTDRNSGSLTANAQAVIGQLGGRWEPEYLLPENKLHDLRLAAERNLSKAVADLRTQFIFTLPAGADPLATLDALNALNEVEIASPLPLPAPAPLPGNYQPNQGYLNAPTNGVNAVGMWAAPFNTTGVGVRICDVEYSWNLAHQDLPAVTLLGPAPVDPFSDTNHGTAVLGEMASLSNGWGTTGIAHGATFYVAAANTGAGYNVGNAIITALGTLTAGDIILIEQQIFGPNYTGVPPGTQFGLVPSEWVLSVYNAIVTAVGNGVTVVEAAGNGSQNLDDAVYSVGNGGHWPFLLANDSGAIIVGAGGAPAGASGDRSRLSFSCYGATVDLQGWGERVYSTGYGNHYNSEGVNLYYTFNFSGTSSASPIVAGSCALLQSIYKAANPGFNLTPAQMKTALRDTGSPQLNGVNPATQNIGPRPNVTAAAATIAHADCDGNGVFELNPDTACFVEVVTGVNSDPGRIARSDFTGDTLANGDDIPGFVECAYTGCP